MTCPYPVNSYLSGEDLFHPIHTLQQRAIDLSGIDLETANAIDDINIGNIIGEYNMLQLYEKFYKRCTEDPDAWFSDLFIEAGDEYASNNSEFLLQRLGGESYYADRKGIPNLLEIHAKMEINEKKAERYLDHMEEVLTEFENSEDISAKHKKMIMNYFRFNAYMLVAAQEASENFIDDGPVPPNADLKDDLRNPHVDESTVATDNDSATLGSR